MAMAMGLSLSLSLSVVLSLLMLLVVITVGITPQRRKPRWLVSMRHAACIFPVLNALGAEDVVDGRSTIWLRVQPALDGVEHGPVCFVVHVADRRVVEDAQTVVYNLCL